MSSSTLCIWQECFRQYTVKRTAVHFTVYLSIIIQISCNSFITLIHILMQWSLQNFAHAMTAVLSWHMQNLVVIWLPATELQYEFSKNLNYKFKKSFQQWDPGTRFNIKIPSYQYRKSHCGDKTILWLSWICYAGKTISSYWIRALDSRPTPIAAMDMDGRLDWMRWSKKYFLWYIT